MFEFVVESEFFGDALELFGGPPVGFVGDDAHDLFAEAEVGEDVEVSFRVGGVFGVGLVGVEFVEDVGGEVVFGGGGGVGDEEFYALGCGADEHEVVVFYAEHGKCCTFGPECSYGVNGALQRGVIVVEGAYLPCGVDAGYGHSKIRLHTA